jgi:predicted permease
VGWWLSVIKWRPWSSRQRRDEDLDRELRTHLELETEERSDSGLPAYEAACAARRTFGNVTLVKEDVRHMWGWSRWEILMQDIRHAWRTLRKSPGFAATAILTLALGIGATTAVFTVIDSVILKPLSYPECGSLVVIWERVRFLGGQPVGPNPRHVDVWRERATGFRGLTVYRHMAMGIMLEAGRPRQVGAIACLPNLFEVLEVKPMLGRTFLPGDGVKGRDNVVVLTYSLWQSLFQGDSRAIGKTVLLDAIPREVIGVLPPGFHFPNRNALLAMQSAQPVSGAPDPALFFPPALDVKQFEWNGNYGNWIAIGRLNPGVSVSEADTQLNAIQAQVAQNLSDRRPGALLSSVQLMQEAVVGNSRMRLWLLLAAVVALMLIACLNLANAQLGRALGRRREAAMRTALGAPKWRLVWSALAENLLLTAIGGTAGVILASVGLDLLRRYSPVDLPRMSEVRLNVDVLLFAVAVTVAAALLSGMLPAMRLLSADPQAFLQQSDRRMAGSRQSHRLRTWLIGFQAFGCTALLLVTGLFLKSLLYLLHQEKGFETGQVTIAEAGLTPQLYGEDRSRIAFIDTALGTLRAIPGVHAAGLVSTMPLEGERWIEFAQRVDRPELEGPMINLRWVSPGYFEATRHKLAAGRFFEERDRNLNSVVLSEGEAKALWGAQDPIGGQVKIRGRTCTVIGVVADSRNTSLKSQPARMAYLHYKDQPPYVLFFVARGSKPAEALAVDVRQAIAKDAPNAVIARVKTLDAQLNDSLATERFQTFALMAFGAAALLLAVLGIYGVLSYSVAGRRQEIGVRMALGATRSKICALTMAEAGVPVCVGMVTGLAASALAGRVIQSLLYGTRVVDLAVILIVTGLLLAAAAAAASLPAWRAASVDPTVALRFE